LIAFGFFVAVVLPNLGVATPTKAATTLTAPLLPGEPALSSGAPAYDFGFNNGIEYGSPGFAELPSAQARVKAAGLTIDRVWAPYESAGTLMSSSDITWMTNHIDASNASGATCYMELGEVDNLPLMEQEVTMGEQMGCHIFEFGNEIDNNSGYSTATYVNQWIADIPALRALSVCAGTATVSSGCLFGGPTVEYPVYSDSSVPSGYPSAVAYFLARSKATGVLPAFVSWHQYPCNGAAGWDPTTAAAQADCITAASLPAAQCVNNVNNCSLTSLPYGQQEVLGWEQQYLGYLLPTGISETNFDPGSSTLSDWSADDSFLGQYETAVTDAFVQSDFSFAMTYTSLDYAGYSDLDMFCDYVGAGNGDPACAGGLGAPRSEFTALAAEVQKYRGTGLSVTTMSLPSGNVGQTYSATLAASGGMTPYSWSQTGLPGGLTLNAASGAISGTPTASGTSTVMVTVTDSVGHNASASLSLTVAPASVPLAVTTTKLVGCHAGTAYSATLAATGGTPPYTWSTPDPSAFPPGITLSSTGKVSGTDTTETGKFTFTVTATDASGKSASKVLSVAVSGHVK
jgi:hypothetical protein